MKLIAQMQFGSHVYGTNVPESDTDIKQVYIPEARDIILQKVKNSLNVQTKSDIHMKNTAEDIDTETFSYQQFIKLLMEGQTVALDMVFTPYSFHRMVQGGAWLELLANKQRFLHKGTTSFVGYCKTQAAKYGLKGGRMAAIKEACVFLDSLHAVDKLEAHWEVITALANNTEHMGIEVIEGPNGQMLPYWNVCGRKMGQTNTVQYSAECLGKIYDSYGHRAKLAEKNEGIDWKALMHAVRVAQEAKELLLTGTITFPRPEAWLLLSIRKAELAYKQVAEIIEQGLEEVEEAKNQSVLRDEPDYEFADELVYAVYKGAL